MKDFKLNVRSIENGEADGFFWHWNDKKPIVKKRFKLLQEIDIFCSPKGDIEKEGRTLHCLMQHAKERDPKKQLGPQCMQAIQTVAKVHMASYSSAAVCRIT